jgi:hypothetical protein
MRGSDYSLPIGLAQICLVGFSQKSTFLSLRFSDLHILWCVPFRSSCLLRSQYLYFYMGGEGDECKKFFHMASSELF